MLWPLALYLVLAIVPAFLLYRDRRGSLGPVERARLWQVLIMAVLMIVFYIGVAIYWRTTIVPEYGLDRLGY